MTSTTAPRAKSKTVSLDRAFAELPREAFALWVRIHGLDPVHLTRGCSEIARQLEVAPRSLNRWIGELSQRGYVRIESKGRGGRNRIQIARRLMIVRPPSTFVVV